jgi:parvulin-like peptidyl-prolyl isomerase
MKFTRALLTGLLIVVVISMLSCTKSKDDTILAEFKDRKITLAQFEDVYANVSVEYLPDKEGVEGYLELLTTMLNKEVMAYMADLQGYDKDQTVVQGMEAFEKMGLQAGYLKVMVADKVEVTEEQVQDHYNNKGVTLSVKVILCDTPTDADQVYALLEDGADFESVAKEHSKSPDAAEGGRIVTAHYGGYTPDVQRSLFNLPIGGYTKPIETPSGFHIMKVLRRAEASLKDPFEEIEETIREEVRGHNELLLANDVTNGIRERAGVEWYWDNFYIAFSSLPEDRSLTNPPSRRDEVYPILYFDAPDMDKPLASYNDVTITVKDFSDYYDRASFFARPRREYRFGGIKSFLMERIMTVLVPEEMERSNIKEHPEIKAVMDAKREEFMVNRFYEDNINQATVVTADQVRNFYNDNKDKFKLAEKRRFGVILTGDLQSAQQALDEINNGARFRNVAREYSLDEPSRETLGETKLLFEGEQPEMDKVGFAIKNVGDISVPFETSRGWMILKLTEKTEARMFSLDEARDQINRILKQELNETRLNAELAKWKEELDVVVHEENLAKAEIKDRSDERKRLLGSAEDHEGHDHD